MRSHPGWWLLGAVVVASTVARIMMCAAGPDLDSDSYGHAIAGRRMLLRPTHLAHHWVWLPLLHALYAVMTLLGGGIQAVRALNVVLSASVPIALALLLHRHLAQQSTPDARFAGERDVVPWVAGALVALEPTTLHLGATGQTEPLFLALIVATCLAWGWGANITAAVLLSLASLTRYEAWLLPPVLLALWWFERPRSRQRLLPVLLPGCVIALWCLLQYRSTGEPLHFLRLNSAFAKQYFVDVGYAWGSDYAAIATRYAFFVPYRVMYGLPYALALLGAWWMARRCQPALLWTSVVLLAFVTWGLFAKKHLGLDRHAVALVPAYATAIAGGSWILVRLLWRGRAGALVSARAVALVLGTAVVTWVLVVRAWPRLTWQLEQQRVVYSSANAAALALRGTPDARRIYCDVAEVEVLSNLHPRSFVSGGVDRVTAAQIRHDVRAYGTVLVASKPERVDHLRELGDPVYADQWSMVLRFDAKTANAE